MIRIIDIKTKTKTVSHILTARPTVPSPKTATIEPGSTLAVFQTAPRPEIITNIANNIVQTNIKFQNSDSQEGKVLETRSI